MGNYDSYKRTILRLITDEIGYRKANDYLASPNEDDNNEELVCRMQSLRKYTVGEKTILYRKKIDVFPAHFEQVYQVLKVKGITDITRYSLARMTRKMGNPKLHLFITDGKDYRRINARKVHHINFIIRYTAHDESYLKRFRIVMDRGGIRRLEEIETPV